MAFLATSRVRCTAVPSLGELSRHHHQALASHMLYRSIALSLTAALVGTDALALSSVPVRGAVSSPRGAVSMVESWYDSGKRLDGDAPKQKKEDTLGAGGGHAVGKAGMKAPEITAEEMEIQKSVMTHQRGWRSVLRGPSSW